MIFVGRVFSLALKIWEWVSLGRSALQATALSRKLASVSGGILVVENQGQENLKTDTPHHAVQGFFDAFPFTSTTHQLRFQPDCFQKTEKQGDNIKKVDLLALLGEV